MGRISAGERTLGMIIMWHMERLSRGQTPSSPERITGRPSAKRPPRPLLIHQLIHRVDGHEDLQRGRPC
jgi:hypothetical protein